MGYGKHIPPEQVSIFPRSIPFDVQRIRSHLLGLPYVADDPVGTGTIMMNATREAVLLHVADRRAEGRGAGFGWFSVVIKVTPEWVTVAQNVRWEQLVHARDFVQWMVDHFDCRVCDEYGNDYTEEIGGDASKLYPDLSKQVALLNQEVPKVLEKIILRPESGAFDMGAIVGHVSSLAEAVADPFVPDLFLLIADDEYAREHVVERRRARPDVFPFVGAIEVRDRSVVIHQNTWGPTRTLCLRLVQWIGEQQPVGIYDELGREHFVRGEMLVLREGVDPVALGEATFEVASDEGDEPESAFLQRMKSELDANKCRWRSITIYEPKQITNLFEYDDGTVVWYRPNGTFYLPGPTYSVGVKMDPSRAWAGPEDTAFKIDPKGRPVPKNLAEPTPDFPPDRSQDLVFKETLMGAGERRLKR